MKWPGMDKIRDSADILQPEKEETYQFIEKLLSSVKENFSTNRVHLGMDEAVMLGLGNYLKENGYKKGSLIIREHCNRVVDICRKLELKPMIWSDMYITANSTGGYYDLPENTDCSKWEKPKKDLGLVYWDYYHADTRTYEKMLDIHAQFSDNVIFAGGSWIWNGISPNYSKTYACTKAALSTCKKYNIKEVLCTAWMDNGAETPVDALLPGLVLFAHLDFHRDYDETILKQEFRNCTGGEFDDFMEIVRKIRRNCPWDSVQTHESLKKYLLEEGRPVPFLIDLGVMSEDGKIKNARYDKFRQLNRFLEFIEDILPKLPKEREVTILDFGCGKSYLTFAMYHYLHELKHYDVHIIGLDLKTDVIEKCNRLADKYGYEKLNFYQGDIASYEGCEQVDMVVTLHACDTATDYALEKAVRWNASVILSVPCCQHELNRQIKNETLAPILEYGILKERFSAILTDGLRAQMLESKGYDTQILEFIDMEHTPKNLLIRAVRTGKRSDQGKVEKMLAALNIHPTLDRLLNEKEQEGSVR